MLSNSVVSLTELGNTNYKIRIDNEGNAEWKVGIVSKTACPVDVSMYPFDTQQCEISFTPWGYTDTQVKLICLIKCIKFLFCIYDTLINPSSL